jgi:hypothetical protein
MSATFPLLPFTNLAHHHHLFLDYWLWLLLKSTLWVDFVG